MVHAELEFDGRANEKVEGVEEERDLNFGGQYEFLRSRKFPSAVILPPKNS
jgi:hypothetical protein